MSILFTLIAGFRDAVLWLQQPAMRMSNSSRSAEIIREISLRCGCWLKSCITVTKRRWSISTENGIEWSTIAKKFWSWHSISLAKWWLVKRFLEDDARQNVPSNSAKKNNDFRSWNSGASPQNQELGTEFSSWSPLRKEPWKDPPESVKRMISKVS